MKSHMKKHRGQTRCPICHQEFSVVNYLRRHMVNKHGMSREEVDRMTNKRKTTKEILAQLTERSASGVGVESTVNLLCRPADRTSLQRGVLRQ